MPLSQLLSKFLDNVNLGKIVVDGGPGVILALALLLFACRLWNLPVLKLTGELEIQKAELKVSRARDEVADQAARAAAVDQQLQCLTKTQERAEAEAANQRGRLHFPNSGGDALAKANQACRQVAELRSRKAKLDKKEEFSAKRLDEAQGNLEKLHKDYLGDGQVLLSKLIDLLLGLSILGYILGTLFSSGYRAIVLEWTSALWFPFFSAYKTHSIKRRTTNLEEHAGLHLQLTMEKKELQYGSALILEERARATRLQKIAGDLVQKHGNEVYTNREFYKQGEEREEPIEAVPAMYYVGRGIISQQEYDGFVRSYYRWAEAATNLVLPVLLLGCAIQLKPSLNRYDPFFVSLLTALLLYAAAQHSFSVYRRRLRTFIKGRLDQDQQRRNEAKEAKSQTGGQPGSPRPARQRLEISFEGSDAAGIVKWIEDRLQNPAPKPQPEGGEKES